MLIVSSLEISSYLPHQGKMCLLEKVLHHDENSIQCLTTSHQSFDNPLRANNRLHAVNGVEYAAQAAALHMSLKGAQVEGSPINIQHGYLAAVQSCQLNTERLDALTRPLQINCSHLFSDAAAGTFYEFSITDQETVLVSGQFLIMFQPQGH